MEEQADYQQVSVSMTNPLALRSVHFPSKLPNELLAHQIPPILSGRCHPGPRLGSACGSFSVYAIPPGLKGAEHLGTLHGLAYLLLENISYCQSNSRTVQVIGARHRYRRDRVTPAAGDRKRKWSSEDEEEALSLWRLSSNDVVNSDGDSHPLDGDSLAIIDYRRSCEAHVTQLLERAAVLGMGDKQGNQHDDDHGLTYPETLGTRC